ncbi:MAG: hypothetical protein JJU31_06735 [Wenzhouxiangella sp.]|nr:hypothetical protein [Wenzhouxiangella sp.]TVR95343.1 MAG: hypothetical protein EA418_07730 [Wenzhouxiangellaceae bacterium]
MKFFTHSYAPTISDLPAGPRARLALTELATHDTVASRKRAPNKSIALTDPQCWLFWLLRSRQPCLALATGELQADWLILAGAAVTASAGSRLLFEPESTAAGALDCAVIRAGLDWGVRRMTHGESIRDGSLQALILASGAAGFVDQLLARLPKLANGAIVVGLLPKNDRDRAQDVLARLSGMAPGFDAMAVDCQHQALIIAEYKGAN